MSSGSNGIGFTSLTLLQKQHVVMFSSLEQAYAFLKIEENGSALAKNCSSQINK